MKPTGSSNIAANSHYWGKINRLYPGDIVSWKEINPGLIRMRLCVPDLTLWTVSHFVFRECLLLSRFVRFRLFSASACPFHLLPWKEPNIFSDIFLFRNFQSISSGSKFRRVLKNVNKQNIFVECLLSNLKSVITWYIEYLGNHPVKNSVAIYQGRLKKTAWKGNY